MTGSKTYAKTFLKRILSVGGISQQREEDREEEREGERERERERGGGER